MIVPMNSVVVDKSSDAGIGEIDAGTLIRVIRKPYFGVIVSVTELLSELV